MTNLRLSLFALFFLISGCGGPFLVFPGGELSGEIQTNPVDDWSFIESSYLDLETNAGKPYSVELNYVLKDGNLYIDPAEGRTWFEHLKANLDVRIRFDNRVYPVRAVLVGQPGELEGFDADRFIYRLDSR